MRRPPPIAILPASIFAAALAACAAAPAPNGERDSATGTAAAVRLDAGSGSRAGTRTDSAANAGAADDASAARFERYSYDGRSQERAQPGPGEYRNPILSGYYPDPSITRAGSDYYLINSSFTNFPGIPVFHSRDMVNWTQIGNAIDRPGQVNFKGLGSSRGIYAPDISHHDGLFYIVTTCVDCAGNFVMTAADPAGPWSDPAPLAFQGIDPSIFWNTGEGGDGKAYIVHNDAPAETPRYDGHRAIWLQEFEPRTLAMKGERTLLVNGGTNLAAKPVWIEGPHLFRRGPYYYLTAAEGGTGDRHSQVVFRSASVRGPFLPYARNPILSQRSLDPARAHPVSSAGHAKFVQTQNGDWWATFLATRPYGPDLYNIGRETFLLPVAWKDDWPVVLEDGAPIPFIAAQPALAALPAPAATPARPGLAAPPAQDLPPDPPLSGDIAYTDEFTSATLSRQWIGVRTPASPFHRIVDGELLLLPGGRLGDLGSAPSFLARRQQHHIATVSTGLRFRPLRDGDRAGLVAYQSDAAYLFFGLARIGGEDRIALYTREKGKDEVLVASAPVGSPDSGGDIGNDSVALKIQTNGAQMQFDYTVNGKSTALAGSVDATFLSTRKAGGFVGTIIGPYAWRAAPAH